METRFIPQWTCVMYTSSQANCIQQITRGITRMHGEAIPWEYFPLVKFSTLPVLWVNRSFIGRLRHMGQRCEVSMFYWIICSHKNITLQWRHNGRDGVSDHQPHDCLLNRLFRRRSKKTSKLRVTGLCVGNWPITGEFPTQRASNAENVFIWWRQRDRYQHMRHYSHGTVVKCMSTFWFNVWYWIYSVQTYMWIITWHSYSIYGWVVDTRLHRLCV